MVGGQEIDSCYGMVMCGTILDGWMDGMAYSSAHSLIPDVGQKALDFVFNCNGFLR